MPKIRKRDGREVAFDPRKVADAMHQALGDDGDQNRMLADELAAVVAMFLERDFAARTPSVDDVQDLVERVLIETGHARAAKTYILDRRKRAELERDLRVRAGSGATDLSVGVASPIRQRAWSKAKIAAALCTEADLPAPLADEIADAVELRVARSGLRRISVSLIRELVDNELFERGLSAPLVRQKTIGVPRYDLERWIDAHSGAPPLEVVAGRALLQRHALEAWLPVPLAEAHLEGRLHLDLLGAPHRVLDLAMSLPADRVRRAPDLVALVDAVACAARACATHAERHVVVCGLEPLLERLDDPRSVARLLRGLADPGGATVVVALLDEPGDAEAFLHGVREVVLELRRLGESAAVPRLRLALSAAVIQDPELCELLVQPGNVELIRAGGSLAPQRRLLCQRVGINLERAALAAGGSFARFEDELAAVLDLAVQACELHWRRVRRRLQGMHEPKDLGGAALHLQLEQEPRMAIAPLRLGACIQALRRGAAVPAVLRDGLTLLAERFGALAARHGFRGELDVMPFPEAEQRMAAIEAELRPASASDDVPPVAAADLAAFDPWRRVPLAEAMDLTERLALLRDESLALAGRRTS
ncbi:MAG: ATP cone domain-containing protein [Planctomycetota bacterium]